MEYEKIGPEEKAGATKVQAYKITRKKGLVTINDIKRAKKHWIESGSKKFKAISIDKIKVHAGQWLTFTTEEKFNEYFENKVKDPSKFYEFDQVLFFVNWE